MLELLVATFHPDLVPVMGSQQRVEALYIAPGLIGNTSTLKGFDPFSRALTLFMHSVSRDLTLVVMRYHLITISLQQRPQPLGRL